ncbi:MAG: hypothetical protein AB8B70_08400 [Prochlorococcus sp.]|nr:hypothetical protein [Prochlorococcaceae cyanobacterium Fu_MAG_50]
MPPPKTCLMDKPLELEEWAGLCNKNHRLDPSLDQSFKPSLAASIASAQLIVQDAALADAKQSCAVPSMIIFNTAGLA